jgi:uncharacterized membrane protein YqgA involved in biofilm formation
MVIPFATFVNVLAVLIGGSVGLILKSKFPEHIKKSIFTAIGLGTLVIGFKMAMETEQLLILIFSLIIGSVIGETLDLQSRASRFAKRFESKKDASNKFAEGLVTTFILFCVGSMTILGAIDEGMRGDRTLILTKSVLDGFTAIALASYYGKSVLFSVIPLFIFQAGLTILASYFGSFVNPIYITEIAAVGGVLIIAIGINMLEIKTIKVLNFIPSLVLAGILAWIFI